MSDAAQRAIREKSGGDTAVDGLLAGIVAGLGMTAYLMVAGLLSGVPAVMMLGRFDPGLDGRWLVGALAHLAVSGVYGVVFALLFGVVVRWWSPSSRGRLLRFGWLMGLVYGLVLVAMARGVLLPVAGSSLLEIATVQLVIAHVVYGVVLGYAVGRKW